VQHEVGAAVIDRAIDHLMRIVETTGCRVIMDHHALRDVAWRERFARLWDTGRVTTAAAYVGVAETALEPRRAELWGRARKPLAASGVARLPTSVRSRLSASPTRRKLAKGGLP